MKRILSLLLAMLTILSLSACDSSDDESTTSASAQKAETVAHDTNSSETEAPEVTASESSAPETEAPAEANQEANIEMYAPAIESAIADSLYGCDGSGFLYDIDEDGVDELVMLSLYSIYVEEAGFEIDEYAYSIYDIENGEVIAKLARELLIADVGGTLGDISVVNYQGSTAISVRRSRSATTEQGEWNWENEYTILDPQTLQPITTIVTDSSDETDAIEPIITAELFYNNDSDGSMSLEALLEYVRPESDDVEDSSILSSYLDIIRSYKESEEHTALTLYTEYALYDIDLDGTPELIINPCDMTGKHEIYVYSDGIAQKCGSVWETAGFYGCTTGGVISEVAGSSAATTCLHTLQDGTLKETVIQYYYFRGSDAPEGSAPQYEAEEIEFFPVTDLSYLYSTLGE